MRGNGAIRRRTLFKRRFCCWQGGPRLRRTSWPGCIEWCGTGRSTPHGPAGGSLAERSPSPPAASRGSFPPTGTAWTLPRRPARWRNFPPIHREASSPGCGRPSFEEIARLSGSSASTVCIAVINAGLRPCEKGSVGHVQRRKQGEDLKAFERAMPASARGPTGSTRPGGRCWRTEVSLTAGLADRPSRRRGRTAPLRSPGGSSVCLFALWRRCAEPGGVGRWAWPGALAATTSVAAVLLAMLLIGRHDRSVGREGPSIAATAAIPATQAKGEVASVTEQAETPPEGPAAADFPASCLVRLPGEAQQSRNPYGRRHRVGRRPLGTERLAGEPHGRIDRRRGSGRCPR